MRTTHTFVTLPLSPAAYAEIEAKLKAAGYDHAFGNDEGAIDLHGLAAVVDPDAPQAPPLASGVKFVVSELPTAAGSRTVAESPADYEARMQATAAELPASDPEAAVLRVGPDTEGTGFAHLVTVEMGGTVVNSCRADEPIIALGGAVQQALERGARTFHVEQCPGA